MKKYLALIALLSLTACGKGYSDGSRVGTIVKVSYKGLVCKTWEVDMATNAFVAIHNDDGQVSGATNLFRFTVKDDEVLKAVKAAQASGEKIQVTYSQWAIAPPCENGSGYDAVSVQPLKKN